MDYSQYSALNIGTERIIDHIYTPAEVFDILRNKNRLLRKTAKASLIDGRLVITTSRRLTMFRHNGLVCCRCRIEGIHFYLERGWDDEDLFDYLTDDASDFIHDAPYTFELYGLNANWEQVRLVVLKGSPICVRCQEQPPIIHLPPPIIHLPPPIPKTTRMVRKDGWYDPQMVLPLLTGSKVLFDGDMVRVRSRLDTFKAYGLKCVECGIVGSRFYKERGRDEKKYHLSLYAFDKDGAEVLMTADHIMPKYRGGSDNITNLQPMCYLCNHQKDDRFDEVEP